MKLIATIGLLIVILVPGVTHATLVVTEGKVSLEVTDSLAIFGDNLSGDWEDGWWGVELSWPYQQPADDGTLTMQIQGNASAWVDGTGCSAVRFPGGPLPEPAPSCGVFTLTPAPPPVESLPVPFTATGHLNVGDGFDFVGQGVIERGCLLPLGCTPGPGRPLWVYRFTVPEPSTLLLLGTSLGALAILQRRKRAARSHSSPQPDR